jgi:hypothetical protein
VPGAGRCCGAAPWIGKPDDISDAWLEHYLVRQMDEPSTFGHLGGPMAARAATMLAYYRAVQRKHRGLSGGRREDLLRDALRDFLPSRLAVERGEIVSSDRSRSPAIDLIVYDALETPLLDRSDAGGVVVPIEGVYAVIEVSSMLDTRKLQDDADKIRIVKSMTKRAWFKRPRERLPDGTRGEPVPPAGAIKLYEREWDFFPVMGLCFAFESIRLEGLVEHLVSVHNDAEPHMNVDMICSLSKGCIFNGLPASDGSGTVLKDEQGRTRYGQVGPVTAPETERVIQHGPVDDEGAEALKTFYTFAFGTIVRGRVDPINMFAYQQFD